MTKQVYGLLADAPRGKHHAPPKKRLDQEEITTLENVLDALGPGKTSQYLDISASVLKRAVAGCSIQAKTYYAIGAGLESETLKSEVVRVQNILDPENRKWAFRNAEDGTEREKAEIYPQKPLKTAFTDESRLEKLRLIVDQIGFWRAARRVGVSEVVLTRALSGAHVSERQQEVLRLGIDAYELRDTPPTRVDPDTDRDETLEEQLLAWLQDVHNRRICRELLAKAQRKHK